MRRFPPQRLQTGGPETLDPGKPLTLYGNPSYTAWPGGAQPRHALLRAAAAGGRRVLGEPLAQHAGSGCRRRRALEKNHNGIRSAQTRQHYIQIYQAIKYLSLDIGEFIEKGPQTTGPLRV